MDRLYNSILKRLAILLAFLSCSPFVESAVSTQGTIWEVVSQTQYEGFGGFVDGVANVGDVDNDGIDDIAIGSPSAKLGTLQYVGKITVYSGNDGTILKTVWGSGANASLGANVGRVSDFTNDGIPEFIGSGFPSSTGATVFLGGGRRNLDHRVGRP